MSDIGEFVKFASTGVWSGRISADYADSIKGFDYMLKTHISSQSLEANHYWGQPKGVVDQEWWDSGGERGNILKSFTPRIRPFFSSGLPDGQIFRGMFRSNATGQVYQLSYQMQGGKPENGKNTSEVLQMISAYGWAGLEVLFDGALNCTAMGLAGEDQVIGVNEDGSLNVGCISTLPIYYYCGKDLASSCPSPQPDGSCPYFGHISDCSWLGQGETGVECMWDFH